jgi:signal transduction histidine kinase
MKQIKLFDRFLLNNILLAILPLLILSVSLILINRQTLKILIEGSKLRLLPIVIDTVDDFLAETNLSFSFIFTLQQYDKTPLSEQLKSLFHAMEINKNFALISLLDNNGKEIAKVANPEVLSEENRYYDRSNDETFIRCKENNYVAVGNVFYYKDNPLLPIVYPLGKNKGYVFVYLSLQTLWNKIKNIKTLKEEKIFILDGENRVIFRSAPARGKTGALLQKVNWIGFSKDNGIKTGINENGKRAIFAYGSVKSSLPWKIVIEQPVAVAYSPLFQMEMHTIFWLSVSLFIAIFLSYKMAHVFAQPINELKKGAEEFGKGNLDYELKTLYNIAELSTLANTLNSMRVEIKEVQEKLIQSERLAAIGQTTSILGHEIRNFLNVINTATYYLQMKLANADPKVKESLDIISGQIKLVNKLVNDMLCFSRSRPPVFSTVELNNFLNAALSIIPVPADIAIVKDFAPEVGKVMIDQDEMQQVVLNLVNNAIQAIQSLPPEDAREKKIIVSTGYHTEKIDGKQSVFFAISDTGPGIPYDVVKKLFTPFFSTKSRGTGLGLAVVKRITERHKGKVLLHTELNKGTTFKIVIPVTQ